MNYDSIYNIPAYLYFDVLKTANYKLLGDYSEDDQVHIWNQINIEKYNEFGLSHFEREIIRFKKDILNISIDIAVTKDRSLNGTKTHLERQLNEIVSGIDNGTEQKFGEKCAIISKYLGFHLNSREITLYDFLNYTKIIEKENNHGRNKA